MGMPGSRAATLKRAAEIDRMRAAGEVLVEILEVLEDALRPGVSTAELDEIAERMIRDADRKSVV